MPYKYRIQTETYTVYPLQIKENILVANIWARLVASFSDSLAAEGTRKSAYAHTLHPRRTTAKTETIRFSALLILLQFLVSVALHALSCFSTSVSLFKLIHNWTVFYNVSPIPKLNQLFFSSVIHLLPKILSYPTNSANKETDKQPVVNA